MSFEKHRYCEAPNRFNDFETINGLLADLATIRTETQARRDINTTMASNLKILRQYLGHDNDHSILDHLCDYTGLVAEIMMANEYDEVNNALLGQDLNALTKQINRLLPNYSAQLVSPFVIKPQARPNNLITNREIQGGTPAYDALVQRQTSHMRQRMQTYSQRSEPQRLWPALLNRPDNDSLVRLEHIAMIESNVQTRPPEGPWKGLLQFTDMGPFADPEVFDQFFPDTDYFPPSIQQGVRTAARELEITPFQYVHSFGNDSITQQAAFVNFRNRRIQIAQDPNLAPEVADAYLECIQTDIRDILTTNNLGTPDLRQLILMGYNAGPGFMASLINTWIDLELGNPITFEGVLTHQTKLMNHMRASVFPSPNNRASKMAEVTQYVARYDISTRYTEGAFAEAMS